MQPRLDPAIDALIDQQFEQDTDYAPEFYDVCLKEKVGTRSSLSLVQLQILLPGQNKEAVHPDPAIPEHPADAGGTAETGDRPASLTI